MLVKFYRGLKANYAGNGTHADGIYFATDTHELMMNNVAYGISSTQASALSTLTAGASTEGSVAYQIAQVVNGAPEAFDTLKEISDWITTDTTGAAAILADVANKADKVTSATSGNFAGLDSNGNLTDSGSKAADFETAGTAASAIAALDADVSQTAGTDGLALSLTEVDGVVTAISGSIAANTYDAYGSASTVQSTLLGTSNDTYTDNTIYGAKAYADSVVANGISWIEVTGE